jgi:Ni2+-binding GTPase involved in maturation of urease and hydrogenase
MTHTHSQSAAPAARNAKARYIMIGGFLGAGKTTAVGRLARQLTDRGLRVGLITNDQGRELVDTLTLRAQGFDTAEILGGCFCCRFDSLVEASQKLSAPTAARTAWPWQTSCATISCRSCRSGSASRSTAAN